MKYLIEVDESSFEVNTYLVEAESEEAARKEMLEGYGEGVIELTETIQETNEITNVRSIKPFNDN